MKNHIFIFFLLISSAVSSAAVIVSNNSNDRHLTNITESSQAIDLSFDLWGVEQCESRQTGAIVDSFFLDGEGFIGGENNPPLPMVSRFVIVPPDAGIELHYSVESHRTVPAQNLSVSVDNSESALFPAQPAEISEPMVIRGIRLVKVTTYPVQIDAVKGEYIFNQRIGVELRFTENNPINPVAQPDRPQQSRDFRKFIEALAVNGKGIFRDEPDELTLDNGHYLVVANQNCLPYVAPFIEWRRKTGYTVDILSIPDADATNSVTIKNQIQARYDANLDQGLEPFDQILLVGDRRFYTWPPAAGWILEAPRGHSIWAEPQHADYLYACLEGNDEYPDVSVARWCAGSPDILRLFVNRTLAYEATPSMADTGWFGRGAAFSQHWGNNPERAWHPSIHTNVRWAEEALKHHGFSDVRVYEDYAYDQDGGRVGVFEREQYNDGVNLMLGRAESLVWSQSLNGIIENTIFPIRIVLSGHGEYATNKLLRGAPSDRPRGPVVSTCNWGGPPTVPINAVWLETVNAILRRELSFGWARNLAITYSETYFSNFNIGETSVYGHMRTDNDFYGDPGLKAWRGVPRIVEGHFSNTVVPSARYYEVTVTDTTGQVVVPGAIVTLYAPGEMPAFDNAGYANYIDMQSWSEVTGADGVARFVWNAGDTLIEGTPLTVTIAGEGIRPFFGEAAIESQETLVELAGYNVQEIAGNGNDAPNPGETLRLFVVAHNVGQTDIDSLKVEVISHSPFLTIGEGQQIEIGMIEAGATVEGDSGVVITFSPFCPDGSVHPESQPLAELQFHSGNLTWNSFIKFDVVSAAFEIAEVFGETLIQLGEEYEYDFEITNIGRRASPQMTVTLLATDQIVEVLDESSLLPATDVGQSSRLGNADLFRLRGNPRAAFGMTSRLLIALADESGFTDTLAFEIQYGEVSSRTPQGPDGYGYICYEDSDTTWALAPEYDWLEINPDANDAIFEGETVDFSGNSPHDIGEMRVVALPFKTSFYGLVCDSISICSNGYIAPGGQHFAVNFQNWPLDRSMGGAAGMIAPFWDWLKFGQSTRILTYYDAEEGRFIIEWFEITHRSNQENRLTFQVILRDRARWAVESGDPEIIFQYKSIANINGGVSDDSDIAFASVGISSPFEATGLSYTFHNSSPATVTGLADRRALLFSTSIREHRGILFGVVEDSLTSLPVVGARVSLGYGLEAVTDSLGAYAIPYVVNGLAFDVEARATHYDSARSVGLMIPDNDSLQLNFILARRPDGLPHDVATPEQFALESAFPNPFNSSTKISFSIGMQGLTAINLSIYDLSGRLVATLVDGDLAVGRYEVVWQSGFAPAGLYFCRLKVGSHETSLRLVLTK